MECLSKSEAGGVRLVDYAAGRLLGRDRREVAAHLHQCSSCASTVREQAELFDLMDLWEPAPVSMRFNRTLYARIQQPFAPTWLSLVERIFNGLVARPAFPIAALSLLVIAGLYIDHSRVSGVAVTAAPAPLKLFPAVSLRDGKRLDKALDDLQLLHELDLVKDEAGNASHGI